MKKCTVCKEEKPTSEFTKKASTKDGLQTKCKTCARRLMREYYQKNKNYHYQQTRARKLKCIKIARDWLFDYLQKNPCVDCGNKDIRVLEFDHVGTDKVNGVGALIAGGYGLEKVQTEIGKCEVRCKNCHAIKTYERMGGSWHDGYLMGL